MGSCLVVVDHPPVGGFAHLVEAGEEIQVEHFLAERTIEALDEGILIWLSRWMYCSATPLVLSQLVNASPRNSGPLSERTTCGKP